MPGVAVTQSHGLGDAEATVRDYIEAHTDAEAGPFYVCIVPEIGSGLDER